MLKTILSIAKSYLSAFRGTVFPLSTMYICLCKAITDSQIREAVSRGTTQFGQLRRELGLASQCGKCGLLAKEVFDQSMESSVDQEQLFYAVS